MLSAELVNLAKWVSSYYASSLENTLGAMIPASVRDGMNAKTRRMIEAIFISGEKVTSLLSKSPKQMKAYVRLKELNGKRVDAVNWAKKEGFSPGVIDGLIKKGLVKQSVTEVTRTAYADQWNEGTDDAVESLRELTNEQKGRLMKFLRI